MVVTRASAGNLLREARQRAGLSQEELGHHAGLAQSVVSAYESGARQPSLPTLARLVEAAGMELEVRVVSPPGQLRRLRGPLGQRVRQHRSELREAVARHGAQNLRVFGSVARGEESADSDIDLLVDLSPDTGLLGLGRLEHELREILQARVDVIPVGDLKPGVRERVRQESVAL